MVLSIFIIAAPLLLITLGALVSEYAGRLAMFMEHVINLGGFFCYALTLATGSLAAGMLLSVTLCTLLVFCMDKTASHFGANPFLVSLAMNLLFAALTTFFSALIFKTRGVLYDDSFQFSAAFTRLATSALCYVLVALIIGLLRGTTTGLALRITGSSADVLSARGMNPAFYRNLSWMIAASSGALAGCVLTARLSSFVPGVSSGRGWTALAAVFLGRKHPVIVVLAVLVFAIAEYASTTIQNIPGFASIPSSLLLSLPYLLALALIILIPQKK
ncbi:MAG: ABC transporter permease [Treponema sp.]|nr:ABC transporter permease [Treponema sp.]